MAAAWDLPRGLPPPPFPPSFYFKLIHLYPTAPFPPLNNQLSINVQRDVPSGYIVGAVSIVNNRPRHLRAEIGASIVQPLVISQCDSTK
jgi:hypothetical protein